MDVSYYYYYYVYCSKNYCYLWQSLNDLIPLFHSSHRIFCWIRGDSALTIHFPDSFALKCGQMWLSPGWWKHEQKRFVPFSCCALKGEGCALIWHLLAARDRFGLFGSKGEEHMGSIFKELSILHLGFHSTNTLWTYCVQGTGQDSGNSMVTRTEKVSALNELTFWFRKGIDNKHIMR